MTNLGEPAATGPMLVQNEDFARSVTALFDSRDDAETARQDLIAEGINALNISLIADGDAPEAEIDDPTAGGFWATVKDLFMPEEDRGQFAEGVRRGGVTVSVRTDTANHDRVVALLDRDGAVDLDEREEHWRSDGWTGYTGRDPLADVRGPSVALNPDDEDMSYAPPSAATAGFGASVAPPFPPEGGDAPSIESPGALPSSALEAGSETAPAAKDPAETGAGRDPGLGTRRVRSHLWDKGALLPPLKEP